MPNMNQCAYPGCPAIFHPELVAPGNTGWVGGDPEVAAHDHFLPRTPPTQQPGVYDKMISRTPGDDPLVQEPS